MGACSSGPIGFSLDTGLKRWTHDFALNNNGILPSDEVVQASNFPLSPYELTLLFDENREVASRPKVDFGYREVARALASMRQPSLPVIDSNSPCAPKETITRKTKN